MPVSLEQAKQSATDDIDLQVIDEFRKSSDILDRLTFDDVVNPAGGGGTLTYTYTRLATQPTAAFRAYNAEYAPQNVTTTRHSTDLHPLGGAFEIDRVLARVGAAAASQVSLNISQKIKAARALFADTVINGDTAVDANSFDGLNKALTGTTTEYLPLNNGVTTGYVDWTTIDSKAKALAEMARVDDWLSSLDERPTVIYGNRKTLALFKMIAAWADQIDKTTDAFGRPVNAYDGIPLVDLGTKAGNNNPVIGLQSRDADGAGTGGQITNLGDLYAVRYGLDGFHGVSMASAPLVQTWLPDFSNAGAVKKGEVEMGPVGVALKATKAAGVLRNIKSA
ncbi:major capsid protein [Saccharopolyspora sp. NPDC002376]